MPISSFSAIQKANISTRALLFSGFLFFRFAVSLARFCTALTLASLLFAFFSLYRLPSNPIDTPSIPSPRTKNKAKQGMCIQIGSRQSRSM
mmetsp:Transcript_40071/g.79007  ORF Transcript_40071/g.79007 Transcript_40071/m.79007 type:complete len:91 (+) Transcript_40071:942-1214(+)